MKRLIRILCLIMVAAMVLCACGSYSKNEEEPHIDEDFEQGINYWYGINGANFDMEKARVCFKTSLENGNDKALYWLGNIRRYDQDKDRFSEVLDYYQKSADAEHGYGYYGLGTLYETGYGVEKDIEKALECYRKALDLNCEMGAVALGYFYSNGSHMNNDIKTDVEKAKDYLSKALKSRDFETRNMARVLLGDLCLYAADAERNEAEAESYYEEAAEEGYYLGCRRVGDLYRYNFRSDDGKIIEYYEKEAEHGYGYSLAEIYLNGVNSIDQDPEKGIALLNETLEKGDRSAAMCLCGLVYANASGTGVAKNKEAAIDLCFKAIDACGPFDDSDSPDDRLHKPLPYARYILDHYGVTYEN